MNDNTTLIYRNYLKGLCNQAIASEANSPNYLSALETFDRLSKFGNDVALEVALASINMKSALSDAARYIANELEKLPKDKSVEANSIRRLREIYKKMNSQISSCGVLLNGQDYSKEAIEKATVKIAPALEDKSWDYSLNTSFGRIQEKLVLTAIG